MENFPSNSKMPQKPPNEERPGPEEPPRAEKRVESVVQGEVVRRKKPLGKRFAETFIGGSAKAAGAYVFYDVLIPALRDTVSDMITQGVDRLIHGESTRSASRRTSVYGRSSSPYVSYNRVSTSRREESREPRDRLSHRARSTHDFDEILLDTRAEAEQVIDHLYDLLEKYGFATVQDFYDLVEVSGTYTDQNWGWTELRGAQPRKVGGRYLVDLPRPELLKK